MKTGVAIRQKISRYYPGVIICTLIGIAVIALSDTYGIPVMLLALLIGLALHPISEAQKLTPGIHWTSHSLLLFGVALLGFRINVGDILDGGFLTPVITLSVLIITILTGIMIAGYFGLKKSFGVLISGAIAICGVSAAVAISCVLPKSDTTEKNLALTVAGVTVLSTLAMLAYPVISHWLTFNETQSGVFMGASIHNVAQAVGAGYTVSDTAGDVATYVKLLRVSALLPVIIVISFLFRTKNPNVGFRFFDYFPPFLIVFIVLAAVNSFQLLPETIQQSGIHISRFLLIVSLVGIGIKTDLRGVTSVGIKPLLVMTGTTILMAVLTALAIIFFLF